MGGDDGKSSAPALQELCPNNLDVGRVRAPRVNHQARATVKCNQSSMNLETRVSLTGGGSKDR